MVRIPEEDDFGASDFLDSEELKEIGERIIREKLTSLDDGELMIDYRWKRRGGVSGGNATVGKCIKLTGLNRHLSLGAHFCIWAAADHCRGWDFDDGQIEALLYHELNHIERIEPEQEPDKPPKPVVYRTVGHDAELFFAELREYGAWRHGLRELVHAVEQLRLPLEVPVAD